MTVRTSKAQTSKARPEWRLGDRITRAADHAGFTLKELAAEIDVDPSTLSKYIAETRRIRFDDILRISDVCGVDLGWLIGAEGFQTLTPRGDKPLLTGLPGGRRASDPDRRSLPFLTAVD